MSVFFGDAVVLFFLWRFVRTYRLYQYSLKVLRGQVEDTPFQVALSPGFIRGALFATRRVASVSFLIRAFVYVTIALILFPFRNYGPELYLVVTALILFYVPWCVGYWALLRREESGVGPVAT